MKKIRYFLAALVLITLCACTCFAAVSTGAGTGYIPGDLNGDEYVDITDAVYLLQHSIFPETYKLKYTGNVDFTFDGCVDVNDATFLLSHSLFPDLYPIDTETHVFTVVATKNYCFNDSSDSLDYMPLGDEAEEGDVLLASKYDDALIPEIYINLSEFGDEYADVSADEFIMLDFELTYKFAEYDGEYSLSEICEVSSDSKRVSTSEAVGNFVDPKNDGDCYYSPLYPHDRTTAKVDGSMEIEGNTVYFFDAPWKYLKPDYSMIEDDDEYLKYYMCNSNNLKLIDIRQLEDGKYCYYIDETRPLDNAEDLLINLQRVYSKGKYQLEIIDTNGDGIFDYIQYMPATYGFMNNNEEYLFSEVMEENAPVMEKCITEYECDAGVIPNIYYNGADIDGAPFDDGEFVIAYLNPKANYIKVFEVIEPVTGVMDSLKKNFGIFTLDGESFGAAYSYRLVEGFNDGSHLYDTYKNIERFFLRHTFASSQVYPNICDIQNLGKELTVYACEPYWLGMGAVLYYTFRPASDYIGLDELAIPVSNEKDPSGTYVELRFEEEFGDVPYAKLYYNGVVDYYPLNTDDMYPSIDEGYYNGKYNLSRIEGQDSTYAINRAYVDKICKAEMDENGHITLIPLLHAEDKHGYYTGVSRDSSLLVKSGSCALYGNDLGYETEGIIEKVSENRYALVDAYVGDTLLGDFMGTSYDATTIKYFDMTEDSRIIIKNITERDGSIIKEYEYLEYDISNFGGIMSKDSPLTNIQYVLRCDPDSTSSAKLVILYAEAENFVMIDEEEVEDDYIFDGNLIIPTHLYADYVADPDEVSRYPEESFDAEAGKVWYIYAWVDGKMKYVPVQHDGVQPALITKDGKISESYLDKLCTYSVDEDGVYTIKSLGYDVNDDIPEYYEGVNRDGLNKYANADSFGGVSALDNAEDANLQYYKDGLSGSIQRAAGSRFNIPGFDRYVDLKAYTKIIIRVFDATEQQFTYFVFDASSFKESLDDSVEFTNVSYIVSNNPDSESRENLVVLYAETDNFSFRLDKESIRIVSGQDYAEDEDGLWRFYYELYDPTTGAKVYEVPGTQAVKKAGDLKAMYSAGEIIVLEDGMVNDKKPSEGKNYLGKIADKQLLVITEVDEAEGYFGVVPAATVTGLTCKDCVVEEIEDLEGMKKDIYDLFRTKSGTTDAETIPSRFINYDKNTVVAVITKGNSTSLWEYGTMSLSSMEAIASADKSVLCWNDKAMDLNGNYKTNYSEFVKAYVTLVEEKLDPDENPTAAFIIVIANGGETNALGSRDCAVHYGGCSICGGSHTTSNHVCSKCGEKGHETETWCENCESHEHNTDSEDCPYMATTLYEVKFLYADGTEALPSICKELKLDEDYVLASYGDVYDVEHPSSPVEYRFVGWSTTIDGTDFFASSDIVGRSIKDVAGTYYAVFEPINPNSPEFMEMLGRGYAQLGKIRATGITKTAINVIRDCVGYIIDDANNGQLITKEYVKTAYPAEITTIYNIYSFDMSVDERTKFLNLITGNVDDDVLVFIIEYFFGIDDEYDDGRGDNATADDEL